MSDDKRDPVDDLKEGLGLLFRAAKGAASKLPTDKIEDVAKDAVKEMTRAFETIGHEVEKVVKGSPSAGAEAPPAASADAPPPPEPKYDDGYAPEPPPRGPRVG